MRLQYPGAIYHVMARGDGGKPIFETDDDRLVFLKRLEEICGSCGWRVHAWVIMGNHFQLLLETSMPNLLTGMKWLLGTAGIVLRRGVTGVNLSMLYNIARQLNCTLKVPKGWKVYSFDRYPDSKLGTRLLT